MTSGEKAARWIEQFCVYPFGLSRGQHVRLTTEQKEILHKLFDSDESPGEITAPLAAYLALFHIAGPRELAAHVSVIPLNADFFSVWNATGPGLKSVVKPDGGRVVCPELGTQFPPVAA
jgi:hypothetical protein